MELFRIQVNGLPDVSLRFEPNAFCRRLFVVRPFNFILSFPASDNWNFHPIRSLVCETVLRHPVFRKIPVENPYSTQQYEVIALQQLFVLSWSSDVIYL